MSMQLSLVDYRASADGRLYEPRKAVITSAPVNQEMIDFFERNEFFEKFRLYEDSSLGSFSEFTRVRDDKAGIALKRLGEKLVQLLASKRAEDAKEIQSDDEIAYLMGEFHVVTSVYLLIKLKKENFSQVKTSVLKLG